MKYIDGRIGTICLHEFVLCKLMRSVHTGTKISAKGSVREVSHSTLLTEPLFAAVSRSTLELLNDVHLGRL